MEIRTLNADEIECRVQTVKENGCSILLYKDARCDMRILDELFGVFGWQRKHEVVNGNLFCTVSIWDREKNMWIEKQDVGVESNTEKEKGQASDSFKRACFNIGIGRELYTAPFIWISLTQDDIFKQNNGKVGVKTKFHVSNMVCNDKKEIINLEIKDNKGNVRYTLGKQFYNKPTPTQSKKTISLDQETELSDLIKETKSKLAEVLKFYKVKSLGDMSPEQYAHCKSYLQKKIS